MERLLCVILGFTKTFRQTSINRRPVYGGHSGSVLWVSAIKRFHCIPLENVSKPIGFVIFSGVIKRNVDLK